MKDDETRRRMAEIALDALEHRKLIWAGGFDLGEVQALMDEFVRDEALPPDAKAIRVYEDYCCRSVVLQVWSETFEVVQVGHQLPRLAVEKTARGWARLTPW